MFDMDLSAQGAAAREGSWRRRGVGAADVRPSVSIIKGVGRRDADLSNLKQTTCVGGVPMALLQGALRYFYSLNLLRCLPFLNHSHMEKSMITRVSKSCAPWRKCVIIATIIK